MKLEIITAVLDRGFAQGSGLESPLVQKAMRFAHEKHFTQVRKGPGIPYFCHLAEVAVTLVWAGQPEHVVAAGFLHDVVEDQGVSRAELADQFGRDIARIVDEVTNVTKPSDGNRALRAAIEREHLAQASPEGKTVKLADSLSNIRSILVDEPKFAPVYVEEKRLLLPFLKGGHRELYRLTAMTVARGLGSL